MKESPIHCHIEYYYEFKPLQVLCEELNNLINTLNREQQSTDPYPWLSEDDERKS